MFLKHKITIGITNTLIKHVYTMSNVLLLHVLKTITITDYTTGDFIRSKDFNTKTCDIILLFREKLNSKYTMNI